MKTFYKIPNISFYSLCFVANILLILVSIGVMYMACTDLALFHIVITTMEFRSVIFGTLLLSMLLFIINIRISTEQCPRILVWLFIGNLFLNPIISFYFIKRRRKDDEEDEDEDIDEDAEWKIHS